MTRRFPLWIIALAFVAIPLAEIYVIIQVGQVVGAWWTIFLLVADSLFGAWLVRREGRRAFASLRAALSAGRMPSGELADGALILIGGTLMLTPGFLTDIVGFLFVLPITRPLTRRWLTGVVQRRFGPTTTFEGATFPTSDQAPHRDRPTRPGRPGTDDVVRGEVLHESDDPYHRGHGDDGDPTPFAAGER